MSHSGGVVLHPSDFRDGEDVVWRVVWIGWRMLWRSRDRLSGWITSVLVGNINHGYMMYTFLHAGPSRRLHAGGAVGNHGMLVLVPPLGVGLLPEVPASGSFRVADFGRHGVAPQLRQQPGVAMHKMGIGSRGCSALRGYGRAQRFHASLHQQGAVDSIQDDSIIIPLPSQGGESGPPSSAGGGGGSQPRLGVSHG